MRGSGSYSRRSLEPSVSESGCLTTLGLFGLVSLAERLHSLGPGQLGGLLLPMTHYCSEALVKPRQRHVDLSSLGKCRVYLGDKLVPDHIEQILDKSELENLLVDDGKDKVQIVLHLPLEHAVLEVVLRLRALLILQEDVLDEHVQQLKLL